MSNAEANSSSLLSRLRSVDPYEFEVLVGSLWKQIGYNVEVKSGSQDRGVDIVAHESDPFDRKQLLQTKRYTEANKIGSQEIRKYRTLYDQEDDVDTVAIITTGEFTPQGTRLGEELNVELVDGEQLCNLIREYAPDIEEDLEESEEDTSEDDIQSGEAKYEHLLQSNSDKQTDDMASIDQEPESGAESKENHSPGVKNEESRSKESTPTESSLDAIERYQEIAEQIDSAK